MTNTSQRRLETIIAEHAPFLERLARALVRDPELTPGALTNITLQAP